MNSITIPTSRTATLGEIMTDNKLKKHLHIEKNVGAIICPDCPDDQKVIRLSHLTDQIIIARCEKHAAEKRFVMSEEDWKEVFKSSYANRMHKIQ